MQITMQPRVRDQWVPVGRFQQQDYYVRRDPQPSMGSYWGRSIDPDGQVRDRLSDAERQRYIDDMYEELAFLRSLTLGAICDVGCGPGWLLRELDDEWWKCGVETDATAQRELQLAGIACATATRELPDCAYDVVVAHHVIEHMSDPIAEISQIRSILRPGGWLILGTPDFGSPCAKRFGDKYRMLHDGTHVSLFTLESMHRFLRDHMFVIRDVRFPFPVRYATAANFVRWNDITRVSPPWPGNWMTFYCQRSCGG